MKFKDIDFNEYGSTVVAVVNSDEGVIAVAVHNVMGGVCDCCHAATIDKGADVIKLFDAVSGESYLCSTMSDDGA